MELIVVQFKFNIHLFCRYLAHGCSPQVLAWAFKMGVSTVRKIIYETCSVIWEELRKIYVTEPNQNEFKRIAKYFYHKTGMPNCIGAIDGKHINIVCPRNSGSIYYNYKHRYSVVLLAACDANYTFTFVDVGAVGSKSDGGIFSRSSFGREILKGGRNIPTVMSLPNKTESFPYYFVADAAFPLKKNIMRPYPGRLLCPSRSNFNKKLSKARVLIENTFGILSNRWRVLRNDIYCSPENVDKIVLATVTLHNFLMLQKDNQYFSDDLVDQEVDNEIIPGRWREEQESLNSTRIYRSNRASQEAFIIRDRLCEFLFDNELQHTT